MCRGIRVNIIESRRAASPEEQVAVSNAPICLDYKVSDDESFKQIAAEGTVYTSSDIDYTGTRPCVEVFE
jgi:phosphodiesterase/alkaline phosphatase D-like protein